MKRRRGCMICGGTKTVEATDNFGNTYRGCAVCRLLTEAEIAALLQGTAVPPDPRGTDGGPVRQ